MLSSAHDLEGHGAGGLTKPATYPTPRRGSKSEHLVSDGSSMVLKGISLAPACLTRDRLPFVVSSSKDGDSGRRAESANWLALFLKRTMDIVLSTKGSRSLVKQAGAKLMPFKTMEDPSL